MVCIQIHILALYFIYLTLYCIMTLFLIIATLYFIMLLYISFISRKCDLWHLHILRMISHNVILYLIIATLFFVIATSYITM